MTNWSIVLLLWTSQQPRIWNTSSLMCQLEERCRNLLYFFLSWPFYKTAAVLQSGPSGLKQTQTAAPTLPMWATETWTSFPLERGVKKDVFPHNTVLYTVLPSETVFMTVLYKQWLMCDDCKHLFSLTSSTMWSFKHFLLTVWPGKDLFSMKILEQEGFLWKGEFLHRLAKITLQNSWCILSIETPKS